MHRNIIVRQKNAKARQQLDTLLSTGLFVLMGEKNFQKDDHSLSNSEAERLEKFMQQARTRIPNRNMSLEEAYDVVMNELRPLYAE